MAPLRALLLLVFPLALTACGVGTIASEETVPGPARDAGTPPAGDAGSADAATAGCVIGGASVPFETRDPADPCRICQPEIDPAAYSPAQDGFSCGETGWCIAGACVGKCVIADEEYSDGMLNPGNACERCTSKSSATSWSAAADGTACGGGACKSGGCVVPPRQPPGGVVLDGWGGLHPFGGVTLNTANAPYWQGWDIARSVSILPDGSGGWTLDGYGGIHAFGAAPEIKTPSYWAGWDIARALVVLADRKSGYLLDGYGGVHPFGPGAPTIGGYAYWQGWDIARGLEMHLDAKGVPDGGWTLDGWGGIHAFGAAPAIVTPRYTPNYDLWQRLHAVPGGFLLVGRYGILEPVGGAQGFSLAGIADWGGWDIVRDVVPVSPAGAFDRARTLTCPAGGGYCGGNGLRGAGNVLWKCAQAGAAPGGFEICANGCEARPPGQPDACKPPPSGVNCSAVQWWNSALTYGPYVSYGWWDTDLNVRASSQVQLRHDSRLVDQGVKSWGWMPTFDDLVTGKRFRFLHLRPQNQYTTAIGTVYPAGTIVGLSGGDTWDTGGAGRGYSTGPHLCVQTLDTYWNCFPRGTEPCR